MRSVFLLSPASCRGRRAGLLLKPDSTLPIARELQSGTLTLGRAFAFLSSLYFRGKLAYAETFGGPDAGGGMTFVITPTRGLQPPAEPVTPEVLREFAAGDIGVDDVPYRSALERDTAALAARLPPQTSVVLLGSVATGKYVDVLLPILGNRLRYPSAFVGRGDMSRGGLLLRHAADGRELDYEPLLPGLRPRGPRPPRLPPQARRDGGRRS